MAVYADRVQETTTTTGTGTYSLVGAEVGFRTFVAGAGNAAVVTYAATDGTDWEVGEGTVTDGAPDTLSRTTTLASSNAGAAVNWGAGTKNIFLTAAASRTVFTDKSNTFAQPQVFASGSAAAPSLTFTSDTNTGLYSTTDSVVVTSGGKKSAEFYHGDLAGNTDNTYIAFENYGGSGLPYIVTKSDSANKALGIFSKGTGGVVIGNASGANNILRISRDTASGTAGGFFALDAYDGYTEFLNMNLSNFATANAAYFITSGTSVNSGFTFQTYDGSSYRNHFFAYPRNTVTGTQNAIVVYSDNPGGSPSVEAEGGDANINLDLKGKGTGSIRLNGTATTVSSTGAISTTQIFTHSGSTAHTVSTTGAVTFTGAVVQSTKGFAAAEFSAGSGAPGTITWSNGQNQVRTLTSSGTMTFASPVAGSTYKLRIVQGGSGSYTITWPTIKWAGGSAPTLSTTVGAEDIVTLYFNGTSYYGQAGTGFA